MKKKLFGIFDRRPLIWGHYMLLVGALFFWHYVGNSLFQLDTKNYFYMFIYYFMTLSVSDQLIHFGIGVD